MGDPMRPLMWVSKSQEKLADELVALEHLTRRLNRLRIHMTARIRFNIPTGKRGQS